MLILHSLPASLCHGYVQSEWNYIFSSCESFSADWAGLEFNTFREAREEALVFIENHPLISSFSPLSDRSYMLPWLSFPLKTISKLPKKPLEHFYPTWSLFLYALSGHHRYLHECKDIIIHHFLIFICSLHQIGVATRDCWHPRLFRGGPVAPAAPVSNPV